HSARRGLTVTTWSTASKDRLAAEGAVCTLSWQARLQLKEPAGGVGHFPHREAGAVPKKPGPLTRGPRSQGFRGVRLGFRGVRGVHNVRFWSGDAGPELPVIRGPSVDMNQPHVTGRPRPGN